MTRIYLPVLIVQFLVACKTSHEFDLTNTTPVPSNEAPYIELLIKKRVTNLTSDLEAKEGSTVRVDEVPPTQSFEIDFDKNTFVRIIKAACDSQVKDVKITAQTKSSVEGLWPETGESEKYTARVEIIEGKYAVSCSKL